MLLMVTEKLRNLGCEIIMVNTDGLEFIIEDELMPEVYKAIEEWEKITKLVMEYDEYSKLMIGDVNNYIGVFTNGKIKQKGAYEEEKKVGSQLAFHKDFSMKIVTIAANRYLLENKPIMETLLECDNLYDFCIHKRLKDSSWFFQLGNNVLPNKIIRYYVSKKGKILYKCNVDGRISFCNAWPSNKVADKDKHYNMVLCNQISNGLITNKIRKNIDYGFYEREATKLVNRILAGLEITEDDGN